MSNKEEVACSLIVSGIKSVYGVGVDTTANGCKILVHEKDDDEPPEILKTYPSKGMKYFPVDSSIVIIFSEQMNVEKVVEGFSVRDTVNQNSTGDFYWEDDVVLRFKPDSLLGRMPYTIQLEPDKIIDRYGNALEDSSWNLEFTTMPADTGGIVIGEIKTGKDEMIGVTFLPVNKGKGLTYYLPGPGKFSFTGIPGGKYLVYAFIDKNEDGILFTGSYNPFNYCEKRAFYSDTIDVRPRWETEGIVIDLQ
jgi:hypothetical protein